MSIFAPEVEEYVKK